MNQRYIVACLAILLFAAGAQIARPTAAQAATSPFTDITGTTFEADIDWLHAEGITVGCTATTYCPDRDVIRGEMASFLVRMFDLADGWEIDAFTDDDGTTHEQDINRLAYAGITVGCTPTTYCPADPVRRDAMASFLARAIPLTEGAGRNYFYDDNGTTHEADIDRAAAAGIASGCATWRFCPGRSVTRGQIAGFLHRVEAPVTPPPYPAPDVRTLHVADDGTDSANDCLDDAEPCATIRRAIAMATDGDIIEVGPGTFLEGDLSIDRDITIAGSPEGTTVDASGPVARRVFLVQAEVVLDRLTITGGRAATAGAINDGGGIWNGGRLTITRSAIVGNSANARGGGISSAGFLEIADSTFTDNEARVHHGGAIFNGSRLTVVRSTICGNRAGWGGGGIASAVGISSFPTKSLDVRSTLICDNEAQVGGGIAVGAGTATITNTTIVGNDATWTYEAAGGGIQSSGGSVHLRNVTVASNTAPSGGGIALVATPLDASLANVLVLANTGGNVAGQDPSKLASIIGVPAGLTLADILDPAGLQDNGGPTKTIALTDSATNPALDHGDAGTCAAAPVSGIDQRGEPRTPPCDIGAYEVQP